VKTPDLTSPAALLAVAVGADSFDSLGDVFDRPADDVGLWAVVSALISIGQVTARSAGNYVTLSLGSLTRIDLPRGPS
jgi:hypothetical protein